MEQEKKTEEMKDSSKGNRPYNKTKKSKRNYSKTSKNNIPDHNDYTFYAINDQIAKDIGSIPFNYIPGTTLKTQFPILVNTATSSEINTISDSNIQPAVMQLGYVNSIGKTTKNTDGINMASVQLYTYVRHANSGARNYEAPDIMFYVLAMRDIYSDFLELKRALGLTRYFNFFNHNLPDLLITSCGINPVDLRANAALYRGRLNIIAEKINSFAVPKYFKAFDRSAFITSNIFADSSTDRGQFYVFTREGRYTWSGTTSTTGTELVFSQITGGQSMSARLDALEAQIDALFLDEDALTMSGDILKAFKESELYQLATTDELYMVKPIYDEDILNSIENSVAWTYTSTFGDENKPVSYFNMNITQNNQIITWDPYFTYDNSSATYLTMYPQDVVFNSHKDNPDYKDVLEWSRLISLKEETGVANSKTVKATLVTCGLELLLNYSFFTYFNSGAGISIKQERFPQLIVPDFTESGDYLATFEKIAKIHQFDWHPIIYSDTSQITVDGDLKVTTIMPKETLQRINDSAVYASVYARDLYNKQ